MEQLRLSGEFDHTLDPKGRVTLPARYRDYFGRGAVLVLIPDEEPCVRVYSPHAWNEYDKKWLEPLNVFENKDESWKVREIYRNMDEVEPDRQGRVLLSAQRIKDLDLSGKVKIIGNRTHLEIWNPATYVESQKQGRGNA
jgi:MraZ protein